MLPFSLWGLTPHGVQIFAPTLFLKTILSVLLGTLPPPLQPETTFPSTLQMKTVLLGLLGTLPSPLQLETPFPLPSMKKQSWALEGNFRPWQLKGQIARFGPAARNE